MKLAVLFPGIGYNLDKPLMYYSRKSALECGFEVIEVPYRDFPVFNKDKDDRDEFVMKCYRKGFPQAEKLLSTIDFTKAEKILFISKSIGTVISSAYAEKYKLDVSSVLYTPVAEAFQFKIKKGIAFNGTSDPWVENETIKTLCSEADIPLFQFNNANHSLEKGEVQFDLMNLMKTIEETYRYIKVL